MMKLHDLFRTAVIMMIKFYSHSPWHFNFVEAQKLREYRFPIFRDIKDITFNYLARFPNTIICTLIHYYKSVKKLLKRKIYFR